MSFLYKTMMTRAPNKRKIKINEENLLRLMSNSDEEDEEDEDFTISPDKEKEKEKSCSEDGMTDSSTNEADKSNSDAEDEPRQGGDDQPGCSSQMRKTTRRRKVMPRPTVKGLKEQITSEYYGMPGTTVEILKQAKKQYAQAEAVVDNMTAWPVGICGVCLNEDVDTQSRRLITCQKCGVQVHEDCYEVDYDGMKKTSLERQWICDSCIYGGDDAVCQFCPNLWGCMKETKCGRWVHIICARSILENLLDDVAESSRSVHNKPTVYIQLGDLNSKHYGSKECMLCEDRLVAKTGICIKCDAGLCKSTFHVTCAQRHGLLSKAQGSGGDAISGSGGGGEVQFANCPLHCEREETKARQKRFVLHLRSTGVQRKKFEKRKPEEENAILTRLFKLRDVKTRQRDMFLPPRPLLEQVPRMLSSDAHYTRLLNSKAEKMFGVSTKLPAMLIPKPVEIRKRHYVTPSLTTDFAAYFLDRELRLEEEKANLSSAMETNSALSEKQEFERLRYNEVRSTLIACKSEREELKQEYESLRQMMTWVSEWASSEQVTKIGAKRRKSLTPRRMPPPRNISVSPVSPLRSKEPIPDAESLIDLKACGICHGQENQHMLARCDVCKEWQHLGCLDPPLTQMPKRTKFSLWQCSECADSSGSSSSESESRGSFTNPDGRRLTRRLRRVPEKLAIGFPDGPSPRSTKPMVSQSTTIAKQQKNLREALQNLVTQQRSLNKRTGQAPTATESRTNSIKFNVNKSTTSQQRHQTEEPPANSTSSLALGISCDNYLSLAARMPIINQTMAPSQPLKTPPSMRKIIIVKRSVPSSSSRSQRPVGLGQKRKLVIFPKPTATAPVKDTTKRVVSLTTAPVKKTPEKVAPPKPVPAAPVKIVSNHVAPPSKVVATGLVKEAPRKTVSPVKLCDVCKTYGDNRRTVTCDTCRKNYHWKCCDPPLKSNPVSRFMAWECSDCVDKREEEEEEDRSQVEEGTVSTVTSERRRIPCRKRKPPEVFEPAFLVSNQQKIFKSIEKQNLRKLENLPDSGNTLRSSEITAARCRPVPASLLSPKRNRTLNAASLLPLKIWKSVPTVDTSLLKTFSIMRNVSGEKSIVKLVPKPAPPNVPLQIKPFAAETSTTSIKNERVYLKKV